MIKHVALAAAVSALPFASSAATFYLEGTINGGSSFVMNGGEAGFLSAIGPVGFVTEDFDTVSAGALVNSATFDSGIMIMSDAPSADNVTANGFVKLSTDSTNAHTRESPFTDVITITLPRPTTFLSLEFGGNDGRGVGNNSGTVIDIEGVVGDFTRTSGVNTGSGDYEGFLGFESSTAFTSFTFSGLDIPNKIDDDFSIDNVTFAAPIPLPAAAWLTVGGLGALVALRARRKG